MAAPLNIDAFVNVMIRADLVPQDQLQLYVRQLHSSGLLGTPTDLARRMVADGLLTNFHAEQLLAGKYRGFRLSKYLILERIGSGGMGAVFLAVHQALQRRVALKVLPPKSAADPGILERFYREARAAASLDHPNIAHAHDANCDGNLHFLVMEFIDGIDLQKLVEQRGCLEPSHAAQYIQQAAEGLSHAHERKLIHRDIKPGNLMLNRQGVVKILDMGLARFFQDDTDTLTMDINADSVLGTADYIAPEQALHSHQVDIRADIYSLGGTLFYLLTGRPPYVGGGAAQKLLWHQMRPVEDVRTLQPNVPPALAAVVARMMAKDPKQRYQTPQEVSATLADFAASQIPAPVEAMPQWCRAVIAGGGAVPPEALLFVESAPAPRTVRTEAPTQVPHLLPPSLHVIPNAGADPDEENSGLENLAHRPVGPLAILVALVVLGIIGFFIWRANTETVAPVVAKTMIMEAEHLLVQKKSSNFAISVQQMGQFTASTWSGNAQLWASPPKAGEWADLVVPVVVPGKYRLSVRLTKAVDYGIVQFSLNGQLLGQPFNGYIADRVINSEPLDLGLVDLPKGKAVLRITTIGTHEKSRGARYMWGLDHLKLEPEPETSGE